MSELEDQIRLLQEIREKKKEILDQESQARERIIHLAGTDKHMSVGDITLDVSSKDRLKIVDPESVPNFLKSNLPDQQRIYDYFHETGQIPSGVELQKSCVVKVHRSGFDKRRNPSDDLSKIYLWHEGCRVSVGSSITFPNGFIAIVVGFEKDEKASTGKDGTVQNCNNPVWKFVAHSHIVNTVQQLITEGELGDPAKASFLIHLRKLNMSDVLESLQKQKVKGQQVPIDCELVMDYTNEAAVLGPVDPRWDKYLVSDFDYSYEVGSKCDICSDDCVAHIYGTDELTASDISMNVCPGCAGFLVEDTNPGLAEHLYELDTEEAWRWIEMELDQEREEIEKDRRIEREMEEQELRRRNGEWNPFLD